jgi:hypothetical protein
MATTARPKRAYRRKTAPNTGVVSATDAPVRARKPNERAIQAAKRLRNALNDDRFAGIEEAKDLAALMDVTKTFLVTESDQMRDFLTNGKLDNALRVGAAWRYGQQKQWIVKGNTEEVAKSLPYSYSHVRTCGQLFDAYAEDILFIALKWMSEVRDSLTFQLRKATGIDYALECVREFKKYSMAITKGRSEDEALEVINEAHVKKERIVRLAAWQIEHRLETLLFYSTAGDSVMLEKLVPDYSTKSYDAVVEWAKTAPWTDDDDKAWGEVQEKSGNAPGTATTSATRRSTTPVAMRSGPTNRKGSGSGRKSGTGSAAKRAA